MNARDAIRSSSNLSSTVLKSYISDLDDADLMCRPAPECNHLAWQLGHLISAEVQLLQMAGFEIDAELPDGFIEAHAKDRCGSDNAEEFQDKQTYEQLFDQVRAASLAVVDGLPDEALDQPGPEQFRTVCATLGDLLLLVASHPMMHAGQFAVVRRTLGKPILM